VSVEAAAEPPHPAQRIDNWLLWFAGGRPLSGHLSPVHI